MQSLSMAPMRILSPFDSTWILGAALPANETSMLHEVPAASRQRKVGEVMPGGKIDGAAYELCFFAELRDRLRAGDIWVAGSRQYRAVEDQLIEKPSIPVYRADSYNVSIYFSNSHLIKFSRTGIYLLRSLGKPKYRAGFQKQFPVLSHYQDPQSLDHRYSRKLDICILP